MEAVGLGFYIRVLKCKGVTPRMSGAGLFPCALGNCAEYTVCFTIGNGVHARPCPRARVCVEKQKAAKIANTKRTVIIVPVKRDHGGPAGTGGESTPAIRGIRA